MIGSDPATTQSRWQHRYYTAYCTVPHTVLYRIRYPPTLPLPGLAELWKTCPPDVREMAMIWQFSKNEIYPFLVFLKKLDPSKD